jgi:thiamine-phosphate pyrophosphorylase
LTAAGGLTDLPIVAIGGVTADNARGLYAAGASTVCACSHVIASADPKATAAALLARAV